MNKIKIQAIIPTAGTGVRLKSSIPKPFVRLKDKPIFIYTLEAIEQCALIDSIIVVAQPECVEDVKDFIEEYHLRKVSAVVAGGKERTDSVFNGLAMLEDDTKIVVIHDGARPFITQEVLECSIATCQQERAVIVGVPVKPTIKRVNSDYIVEETLPRDQLWEIQTPQVFEREVIVEAYKSKNTFTVTDDASLVEHMGIHVKIINGDYRNIKITTPEDLVIAKAFLKEQQ